MKATALIVSIAPLIFFQLFSVLINNELKAQSISSAANLSVNHGGIAEASTSSIFEIPVPNSDSSVSTVFSTVRNDYSLSELSYGSIGMAVPLQNQLIGVGVSHFGLADYGLTNIHGAISKPLHEKIHLGTRMTFSQLQIVEQSSLKSLQVAIACRYNLSNDLSIAALIDHFISPVTTYNTLTQLGISYSKDSDWTIFVDIRKEYHSSPEAIASLRYVTANLLTFRFSFSSFQNIAGGLGLTYNNYFFDIGMKFHRRLGLTSALTISYQLHR